MSVGDPAASPGRFGRGARIAVLGGLTATAPLSLDTYLPALPAVSQDLGASVSLTQVSLTACVVGLALGQLVAGPVSDVYGRRRPLLVGATGFLLASAACAVVPDVVTLIVLRLAQGLLGSIGIVVARAVVRDLHEGPAAARFFAALMLVSGVAPVVAPVLGGQLLLVTSWRGIFVFLAVLGLVVLAGVVVGVPESLPPDGRRRGGVAEARASFRVLLSDRRVLACVAAVGLSFSAMFAYISGATFVLQTLYGLSPQAFSAVFAINSVGVVTGVQVAGRLVGASRIRPASMLVTGLSVACAGSLALLAVVLAGLGVVGVVAGLFVTVTGVGMALPSATTLALADHPERAGAASALLGAAQFLLGGLVAPVVGVAGAGTALPMGLVMATAAVLALSVFTLTWRSARTHEGARGSGQLGSGA